MTMAPPRQEPTAERLGEDLTGFLPDPAGVPGTASFRPGDDAVRRLAVDHLHVRGNDSRTAYSYGLAAALCALHPEADRDVVLPAIALHGTG